MILAVAERAVYDLLAHPERGIMGFSRITRAFEQDSTQKNWRLDGIYIYPARPVEDWAATFRHFLDGGFLLPPDPTDPLIVPGELSNGEEAALAELLAG
jgi:hypothetical protein